MDLLDPPIDEAAVAARLDALVRRHARAGNLGIQVLNIVGGRAEALLERLPEGVRDRLEGGTEQALSMAMGAAQPNSTIAPANHAR